MGGIYSEPQENWIGQWIHVAYQFREDVIQIFVNGDPILDSPAEFVRSEHPGTLQVGFWARGTFNGAFDEVKLFDEALSQEQIIAEMAPPDAPNPSLEIVRVLDFIDGVVKVSDPLGEGITVALWVQPETVTSDIQTICAAGGAEEPAWALTLIEGRLAWFGGGNTSETPDFLSDTPIVNAENLTPFHLAASVQRLDRMVKVQWLIDGVVQGSSLELPGTDDSVGNVLYLGAFGKGVLPFKGFLDDVQVYDRVLAAEEMARLYENPGETLGTLGAPDSDGDGLLDEEEALRSTLPLDPDTDADGLSDGEEIALTSNPLERDTDGGGTWDGVEVRDGSDPLDPGDDLPIWTIHTIALRTPRHFADVPVDSVDGLDIFSEFTFQRRVIDFEDADNPGLGTFDGGEDLDDVGLTIRLQQIHFITGRIAVEEGGIYTLGVAHGSFFRLLVDGEIVAEFLQSGGARSTVAVALTPGVHQIELQTQRGRYLELFHWETPGDFTDDPPFDQASLLETDHVDDIDTDGDGLPDFWELSFVGNLDLGPDDDPDGDGLGMRAEFDALTNPLKADSDGDGLDDGAEIEAGTNPNLADTDADGLTDGEEHAIGTDPLAEDSDGDGLPDGFEVSNSLNPLGEEDQSALFLTLQYDFESGAGTAIENLVGGAAADLYSWNLDNAWGKAEDGDSRGSGFLRFAPVDPDAEVENEHTIKAGRLGKINEIDVSEFSDGSTIIATTESPQSLGMLENGYTMMAWVRLNRMVGGLGGTTSLMTQIGPNSSNFGFNNGNQYLSHGTGAPSFLRSTGELTVHRWHHVAWRYYRGKVDFFIDGRESTQPPNDLEPVASKESELIFSWIEGQSRTIPGSIDDVRIYAAPLAEPKIRQLAGIPEDRPEEFRISSIQREAEGMEIVWEDNTTGKPGEFEYHVEYSETLQGDWEIITSLPNGVSAYTHRGDIGREEFGFYRIRKTKNEIVVPASLERLKRLFREHP